MQTREIIKPGRIAALLLFLIFGGFWSPILFQSIPRIFYPDTLTISCHKVSAITNCEIVRQYGSGERLVKSYLNVIGVEPPSSQPQGKTLVPVFLVTRSGKELLFPVEDPIVGIYKKTEIKYEIGQFLNNSEPILIITLSNRADAAFTFVFLGFFLFPCCFYVVRDLYDLLKAFKVL